jgi:integrase
MASYTKIPAKNKQGYKWICVKDGPLDPITGKRNQIKRRGDTKKQAEERVDKALKLLKQDGINEKNIKNLPFIKVAKEWLDAYALTGKKPGTIRLRKNSISTLNQYIQKVNIDKLTANTHQKILNKLHEKELSRSTIEGVHVTANLIYKYAIKEKYRKDNPATGAIIPTKPLTIEEIESNPIEEKYLERKELNLFLNTTQTEGLELDKEIFYLLTFTGMRLGELLALKWSDVNFETRRIRVTKTLYNEKNNMYEYQLLPPKTKGSIREFDIDELILKMLLDHREKQKEVISSIRTIDGNYHNENFIFCRVNGYPYIHKFVSNRMNRLLSKAKISKKATPHIFRHTHISMLAEAGVDLTTIMKRVGHDDPKTTLQIYTHVTDKMQQNAADKLRVSFSDLLT